MANELPENISLATFYTQDEINLFKASRSDLINDIGDDIIRDVVLDVLVGRNIRNSTETLTRTRLSRLNLALLKLFLNGANEIENYIENLPAIATHILKDKPSPEDQMIARWFLGLTGKGVQNVLRDSTDSFDQYTANYVETNQKVVEQYKKRFGNLTGTIKLNDGNPVDVDWLFLLYLLNFSGAQTLTIRGSEKSLYGKFFEKLVLGTLLHILGFKHVPVNDVANPDKVFWLSSSSDTARESDATLIYTPGKGVRFDIGFIGRGNTEISLDKVSRYRREIEIGSSSYHIGTIIIVDRIGRGSRIQKLAEQIDGHIIQMSASNWTISVARRLKEILDYDSEILTIQFDDVEDYIKAKLIEVPLMSFIENT